MNHLISRALMSCALLTTTLALPAVAAAESITEEVPFSPGGTVELDLPAGGSVVITGWDESNATVTYSDDDLDRHDVRIRAHGGDLEITAGMGGGASRSHGLTIEIRVPREVDVDFESAGGSLTLESVEGRFEGVTGGGSLVLRDVKGEAQLTTGGGEIEVTDSELDGQLTTGGGEVLLRDVVGELEATSGGGDVRYQNVRGRDGRPRGPGGTSMREMTDETVVIRSAGGSIDVDEAPEGASLMTGGGEITVRQASRFVKATTGGGDIDIEIIDGWVTAATGGGDIDIEVLEGLGDGEEGIKLATGSGDVTVTVPRGLSLDFDVEIAYTRNSKKTYDIDSDLDLQIERTDAWDYDHGTPRKTIRGTAKIAGGKHLVRIGTVNGNVRIRVAE